MMRLGEPLWCEEEFEQCAPASNAPADVCCLPLYYCCFCLAPPRRKQRGILRGTERLSKRERTEIAQQLQGRWRIQVLTSKSTYEEVFVYGDTVFEDGGFVRLGGAAWAQPNPRKAR